MYTVTITSIPSSRFGSDEPEVLSEPRLFAGSRTYTARSTYGWAPEVRYAGYYGRRERKPATWATREAAARNVARLADRGYTAHVTCDCMTENPDGYGERVVTHSLRCPFHPEYQES
jgi:hypothetical protein